MLAVRVRPALCGQNLNNLGKACQRPVFSVRRKFSASEALRWGVRMEGAVRFCKRNIWCVDLVDSHNRLGLYESLARLAARMSHPPRTRRPALQVRLPGAPPLVIRRD